MSEKRSRTGKMITYFGNVVDLSEYFGNKFGLCHEDGFQVDLQLLALWSYNSTMHEIKTAFEESNEGVGKTVSIGMYFMCEEIEGLYTHVSIYVPHDAESVDKPVRGARKDQQTLLECASQSAHIESYHPRSVSSLRAGRRDWTLWRYLR